MELNYFCAFYFIYLKVEHCYLHKSEGDQNHLQKSEALGKGKEPITYHSSFEIGNTMILDSWSSFFLGGRWELMTMGHN